MSEWMFDEENHPSTCSTVYTAVNQFTAMINLSVFNCYADIVNSFKEKEIVKDKSFTRGKE